MHSNITNSLLVYAAKKICHSFYSVPPLDITEWLDFTLARREHTHKPMPQEILDCENSDENKEFILAPKYTIDDKRNQRKSLYRQDFCRIGRNSLRKSLFVVYSVNRIHSTNNIHVKKIRSRIRRRLQDSLYLIVKQKDTGYWNFPSVVLSESEVSGS